jgi:inner membrane protein involved in colicin E2 resistance
MLKQKNESKIINGKPYLLEFQSNHTREIVSTAVKFPETKTENIQSKPSKNMKIKSPYYSNPVKKHENISQRNNGKKITDSIESLYYGVNEKNNLLKSNKISQKSNKIYSYLMYNESMKYEDLNPLKKKLVFSSRISKNILSTSSKEKKKKL